MENVNSMVVVVMCLLAMHFSFIQCTHFDDLKEEVNALIAFKSKLAHPSKCLSSWDESLADASTWLHVTANNDNSVIRIDLEDCQLEGPLASELGQLKNLTYLELYNNKLNGSIPENLGNLASLLSLDLYGNKLDGSIPEEMGILLAILTFAAGMLIRIALEKIY